MEVNLKSHNEKSSCYMEKSLDDTFQTFQNWNRIWRKRFAPQDSSFFNLQKIAESTKHTLTQARLARWPIDMAWCC